MEPMKPMESSDSFTERFTIPSSPFIDGELKTNDRFQLGADMGALMLFTAPLLIGSEIELIPDEAAERRTVSLVRERDVANGVSFAAIYPHLRKGTYTIGGSAQRVAITAGRVTTLEYHDGCCRVYYHPSPMSVIDVAARS